MNDSPLTNPFMADPVIDPRGFVGRQTILRDLISHMTGVQPISVNVVGASKMGKSSLLRHFTDTWPDRLPDGVRHEQFVVVHVLLKGVRDRASFWERLGHEMGRQSRDIPLRKEGLTESEFITLLDYFVYRKELPVFCLDDFHDLFKYPTEFDGPFLESLRSSIETSKLMFILATREPISHYVEIYKKLYRITSLFNVGHKITLAEFSPAEVMALLTLPHSLDPRLPAALSPQQQQRAQQWGGQHPHQLQLAAYFLCHATLNGESEAWAYHQFQAQQPTPTWWRRLWQRILLRSPKP